jgi:hypothetical protein
VHRAPPPDDEQPYNDPGRLLNTAQVMTLIACLLLAVVLVVW